MNIPSVVLGKSVFWGLRALHRTGSALPGLVVEKTNRRFLAAMLTQLPQGVVVVSGTNGKTTTTKLVTALLESQGLRVLTNPTGSNFVRGTISAVIDKATWGARLPYDIAVFEQDEAHAVHFARTVKPRGVLVLNIMRDQMDRFGEIDTTLQLLQVLALSATEFVVLNANDERVSRIKVKEGVNKLWYAHSEDLQPDFLTDDQLYHAESAAYILAGKPNAELVGYDENSVSLRLGVTPHHYKFQLAGGHNALNLTAALTVLQQIVPQPDTAKLAAAILTVEPAFGRGETIQLAPGNTVILQLVKNPGGFTQALRMLELKSYKTVGIAINDDYPDGRDVSWLWDIDFESLQNGYHIRCSGDRAADMTNRLKYDEVLVETTEPDLAAFANSFSAAAGANSGDSIIFCTYTAMLKLRELYLGAQGGLDEV
jgi:UDP-N-acetylmuramyl tripeptide synthase